MPILFLSDENKEHLLSILKLMCRDITSFEKKITNSRIDNSYCFENEIVTIYFKHKPGEKKIELEYIDVHIRDEANVKQFENKIREGCILSDCQMRRKIISDIRRSTEKVEILVPWMTGAIYSKAKTYQCTMLDAIEQALKNGAEVIIGCGNSEDSNKDREKDSKKIKEELEAKFGKYCHEKKLIFHMRSFTHEKFLVVDNRIAMCGSYNFLSNSGRFDEKKGRYYLDNHFGSSGEAEYPGESMKITENIESIKIIQNRIYQKYN